MAQCGSGYFGKTENNSSTYWPFDIQNTRLTWGCYQGPHQIVKQLGLTLLKFINGGDTLKYWTQHKQYSPEQLNNINWPSLSRAMKSVPLSKHRWASKQMSGHFAHGKNVVWWQQCTSANCPWCRHTPEDKPHISRCTQDEATLCWTEAVNALMHWMKEEQSNPPLIQALTHGLQAWQSGMQLTDTTPVYDWQTQLRWDVVLDGWLSVEWQVQQEVYWVMWKRKKSSRQWILELIKKLWNVSLDMWEHRNVIMHNSLQLHEDILDSKINERIKALHNHGPQAVPCDGLVLFQKPLADLLQQTRHYKEKWVASVEAAQERKRHHNFGAYLQEQQFMRWWLGLEAT